MFKKNKEFSAVQESISTENSSLITENTDALNTLRSKGFKIKLVTPTKFGTQVDFAKKYNDEEIQTLLKDYTIKIKGQSVFIDD